MKYLRLTGGFLLLLFVFSSCVKEVTYYEEEIPQGNVMLTKLTPQRVSDNLILEIVEISDTRCPVGAVCSSAGVVSVEFKASINGKFSVLNMSFEEMNNSSGCISTFEGHQIQILHVSPHPYMNEEIDVDNYRVEIKVEKLAL